MPERRGVVARELTKLHEEFVRGSLQELAVVEREWIGEVTVVLGTDALATSERQFTDEEVDERIDREIEGGQAAKTVAQRVAAWSGRSRREVYERVVERKQSRR